jgi:TatD DNase family protein
LIKIVIGFHPRKVKEFNIGVLSKIQRLLTLPGVVGLGEIGLDWTEPQEVWEEQESVFRQILQNAGSWRVLVLHLRGKHSSDYSVYFKGLEIVQEICNSDQIIHLHCFGGDCEVVAAWATSFPNCYFGFTASVAWFRPEQVRALKAISLRRLLLETDSPYLAPGRGDKTRINTPIYIGDVAGEVASRKGVALRELLRAATCNGRQVYFNI